MSEPDPIIWGFFLVFFLAQFGSQAATIMLWRLEEEVTGRHAVFPWSLAYWVWMFSTPRWASHNRRACTLLGRMRILGASSLVGLSLVVLAALTSASS